MKKTRPAKRRPRSIDYQLWYEMERKKHEDEGIISLVCDMFSVPKKLIKSKSRKQRLVHARHMIMHLLKTELDYGVTLIGYVMNRDHSTVLHAIRSSEDYMEIYPKYRENMERVKRRLRGEEDLVRPEDYPEAFFQKTITKSFSYTYNNYVY